MALALVQYATATADGASQLTLTLASSPTAGNVLICATSLEGDAGGPTAPVQNLGPTLIEVTTGRRAHSSFGSWGFAHYRSVVAGDGVTCRFNASANRAGILAEFSGLGFPATLVGSVVTNADQESTTLALALTPGSNIPVFASFGTRLTSSPTFTANGSSTQVNSVVSGGAGNSHGVILVYGAGNVTLGGTQGGGTQDGYWWGGIAWAFAASTGKAIVYFLG